MQQAKKFLKAWLANYRLFIVCKSNHSTAELARTFGGINYKICSCETESIRSDAANGRPPSVVLKGQGRGQGVVCMDKNGKLTFSQRDEKEGGLLYMHLCSYDFM